MERREVLAAFASMAAMQDTTPAPPSYVEVKTWRLHTTPERQETRVADFLEHGLAPALDRAGAQLAGAFANVIGPDGPYYVTLTRFDSLAVFEALASDRAYLDAEQKLASGPGLPFVRVESSILRLFAGAGRAHIELLSDGPAHIFELRTYENQSFAALRKKIAMFEEGEAGIFRRLGFHPVFFGATLAGPKQPNLMYMLTYESLAQRDELWSAFGRDPEWQRLRSQPGYSDPEIVANISNVILRPLPFSRIR